MNKFLQLFVRKYNEIPQQDAQANAKLEQAEMQGANDLPMAIVYINGLTDTVVINDNIIKPIMSETEADTAVHRTLSDSFTVIKDMLLTVGATNTVNKIDEFISALYNGNTVILAEGWDQAISASTSKWKQRGVEEPSSQSVVRGPKDGFTENISTNAAIWKNLFRIKPLPRFPQL